jgi:hypothetical protein
MGANPVADMADEVRDMTDELVSTAGGDKIEDEGIIGGALGAVAGGALGGPMGAIGGYSAGSKAGDDLAGDEKEGYSNSPKPQVKAHSYGDDQVTIGKAKSEPYTGLGNNNLKKQTESVDPVEQVSLQLLKAYAEFKNQK